MTAAAAGTFAIGGDLAVHRLGFGAMRLKRSSEDPPSHEREAAHAVLRRATELGVTLIDTAPLYGAREGLIGHLGLSNVDVDQLRRAQAVATVASVQNRFSLAQRASAEVLDVCTAEGIAFLPWQPLAHDGLSPEGDRALADAAARLGATTRQVALAWVLGRAPVVVAIPGTGDIAHLEQNVAAAGLALTDDERTALDAAA